MVFIVIQVHLKPTPVPNVTLSMPDGIVLFKKVPKLWGFRFPHTPKRLLKRRRALKY